MKKARIAIVGGSFTGMCLAAHLIRLLRLQKKYAEITVFEGKGLRGGRIFSIDLPNNFTLNHEANFMGAVNAFTSYVGNEDFFVWLKEHTYHPLKSLKGKTIAQEYVGFDLKNPKAHLPRSLYGHYLEYRLDEMLSNNASKHHQFTYKFAKVTDIKRHGEKMKVVCADFTKSYDTVILATGFWFKSSDTTEAIYKKEFRGVSEKEPIGIIGSSLSAIELALSLSEQGHKNITLLSRNGRLPKVRGETAPYNPVFLTNIILEKVSHRFENVTPKLLFHLLKMEFDTAYNKKNAGLYQAKGINWYEILHNTNPINQLKEDIRAVSAGKELIWRSVLQAMHDYENQLWRGLQDYQRGEIVSTYSSLLLSYIAPMPLSTAKKLYKFLQKGTITLVAGMKGYEKDEKGFRVTTDKNELFVKHLIDGRGPSKDISQNEFLSSLMQKGLLEKNVASGIVVNKKLQAVVNNKAVENLHVVGPMIYGERPHNSTVFAGEYAEQVAWTIVNGVQKDKKDIQNVDENMLYDQLYQLTLTQELN